MLNHCVSWRAMSVSHCVVLKFRLGLLWHCFVSATSFTGNCKIIKVHKCVRIINNKHILAHSLVRNIVLQFLWSVCAFLSVRASHGSQMWEGPYLCRKYGIRYTLPTYTLITNKTLIYWIRPGLHLNTLRPKQPSVSSRLVTVIAFCMFQVRSCRRKVDISPREARRRIPQQEVYHNYICNYYFVLRIYVSIVVCLFQILGARALGNVRGCVYQCGNRRSVVAVQARRDLDLALCLKEEVPCFCVLARGVTAAQILEVVSRKIRRKEERTRVPWRKKSVASVRDFSVNWMQQGNTNCHGTPYRAPVNRARVVRNELDATSGRRFFFLYSSFIIRTLDITVPRIRVLPARNPGQFLFIFIS